MTKSNVQTLHGNSEQQIFTLASELLGRAALAARLGKSYGNDRDLYVTLGYVKEPKFEDYYAKYQRQDIAKRIVSAPVKATWRLKPNIVENKDEETPFEKAWINFVKTKNPYHYIARADRIAGIGQFGILYIGFDDVDKPDKNREEVTLAKEILYLRPYMQKNIDISVWETDTKNPRFGQPKIYKLQTTVDGFSSASTKSIEVHHSRIIHIAEGLEENDIIGTPRLECVLNRLQDLDLISGGSAEMFWRGAFPGLAFSTQEGYQLKPQDLTDLKDEIENYVHNLTRYLRLKGLDVRSLAQQVADPSKHFDVLISLISAATGIPKRILLGSERGELASSQDRDNWAEQVDDRRVDHAEPMILRPFINKLIQVKILPEPKDGHYSVEWPDLFTPSDDEKATVAKTKTEALASYSNAPNAGVIVPQDFYLTKFLGFTQDDLDQIKEMQETMQQEEDQEIIDELD